MQPLLLLIKNDSFFVHENQRLTRKKHKWGWGYCLLFRSSCDRRVFVLWWNERKLWRASHIVHTWDEPGPFAHLFAPASSRWSWLNSHQTAEWDQMILTTGKYLWAEKSNSGSAWRCTGLSHQSIRHSKSRDSQIVWGIYVVCHLGLLFMSTSQELHDHNVGFGHLQYAIHLLTTKNINKWLPIIPVAVNIFTQREKTFEVKDIL